MQSTARQAPASEGLYFGHFDYLRGFLALVVSFAHGGVIQWSVAPNLAVQVFFALSGWLIGGILLDTTPAQLPRFFFNRSTRIWFPYFAALGLVIAASVLRDPMTPLWWNFIVYKASFVYSIFGPPMLAQHVADMPLHGAANHFWSINVEEQFYLASPLLLVLLPRRFGHNPWLWAAICAALFLTQGYAWMFVSIATGVLAAILARRHPGWRAVPGVPAVCAAVAVASFAAMCLGADVQGSVSYQLAAPLFSVSLVLLLAVPTARSSLGEFIGGVSYPFYLNHWLGVFLANALLGKLGLKHVVPLQHALAQVLAVAVAVLAYLAIDRQVRQRRAGWYSPALGRLATALAYGTLLFGLAFGTGLFA